MTKYCLPVTLCFFINTAVAQQGPLEDTTLLKPIEVIATRAGEKTPVAKTNLSKKDIERNNTGVDIPFVLREVPSVVANSDAGNGIGYTGIRIRGTDATRINVTLNNIPYNDAESQGSFFVDMPDIISSASSIQVVRGAGTSTNGAGAFGASINISTNEFKTKQKLELDNAAGSYGSFRNTLSFNSGLLGDHFSIDARLSNISSSGYIERASSSLQSFFTSAAYADSNQSVRLNIFSGKEKTYQAWYGVREDMLETNRRFNPAGTDKPGEPYRNETDNYIQTHYQLFYNRKLNKFTTASLAMFLTRGKGYYEQYKSEQKLNDYGLPDFIAGGDTISTTDLVRRLWLDNYFYGTIFSLEYKKGKDHIIGGAGWNRYDGGHYGEVKWAEVPGSIPENYRWYDLDASKKDLNIYAKWERQLNKNWMLFADMQMRHVDYFIGGFRNNPGITVNNDYTFFNPKFGLSYQAGPLNAYLSFARAAKEPNRDDFEAGAAEQPIPEILNDWEAGISWKSKKAVFESNLYFMDYRDQLILTGKINDVGAYTRTNVDKSYRAGIELSADIRPVNWAGFYANATFSQNKIREFTEYVDDYDNGGQQSQKWKNTDIAFSPSATAYARIDFFPCKQTTLSIGTRYTGRQFLDNTSNEKRSLDPFLVSDIRISYDRQLGRKLLSKWFIQLNNVFSEKYEPNGYTFSYFYEGRLNTENYFFPMAPFNFMAGLKLVIE